MGQQVIDFLNSTAGLIVSVSTIGSFIALLGTWLHKNGRRIISVANIVERELVPNGGASLKDHVSELRAEIKATRRMTGVLYFKTDAQGLFVEVAPKLADLPRAPREQIFGSGWIDVLMLDDRARVRKEWAAAVNEMREFSTQCRFPEDGANFEATITTIPVVVHSNGDRKISGFIGWVQEGNNEQDTSTI